MAHFSHSQEDLSSSLSCSLAATASVKPLSTDIFDMGNWKGHGCRWGFPTCRLQPHLTAQSSHHTIELPHSALVAKRQHTPGKLKCLNELLVNALCWVLALTLDCIVTNYFNCGGGCLTTLQPSILELYCQYVKKVPQSTTESWCQLWAEDWLACAAPLCHTGENKTSGWLIVTFLATFNS